MSQSVGMMALNSIQPFASESFAKKLALLVLEDRYPRNVFSPEGEGVAVSDGDVWLITFQNALFTGRSDPFPVADGILLPRTLTFKIRKSDAAVLDII